MTNIVKSFITSATIGLTLVGCSESDDRTSADTVFLNGKIYTADATRSMASAFALKDGSFIYVGDSDTAKGYIGPNTEIVKLNGALILPGLHDNHIHPGGVVEFDRCDLEGTSLNFTEMSLHMQECLSRLQPKDGEWLMGEQWSFSNGNAPTYEFKTMRAALDAVSTTIPITLSGNDGHHSAYNSIALAMAKNSDGETVGLSKETVTTTFDHYSETIAVDASGEPNGYVNERARELMASPSMIEGDNSKVVANADQIPTRLNSIGITSIHDVYFIPEAAPYYKTLSSEGKLSLRVTLSQFHNPLNYVRKDGTVDWDTISAKAAKTRDEYANIPNITANGLKLFVDGVAEGNPLSTPPALPNAAFLSNYKQPIFSFDAEKQKLSIDGYVNPNGEACASDRSNVTAFIEKHGYHPDQCTVSNGVLESPREMQMEFVRRFDSEGYTLHLHAIGDRAIRTAVDALEQTRGADGKTTKPHALSHIQFVHPDDIKRIGDLGLYLTYTYAWILADPEYDLSVMPFMDQVDNADDLYKADYYSFRQAYPVKSTKDAGAILVAGSDAPVDTRDPRPFINMQQAVTRAGADGTPYNASERISITDVIDAYTINGAAAMGQADIVGSIEMGKRGDFIILDRDIIALGTAQPTAIGATKVTATWFDGKKVYSTP